MPAPHSDRAVAQTASRSRSCAVANRQSTLCPVEIGTLGEWVSGAGSFAAAAIALTIANQARAATVRDRVAQRIVRLMEASATDLATIERDRSAEARTPAAEAACRALWSRRNAIGTVWSYYCQPENDQYHRSLAAQGSLAPMMRTEMQEALDDVDRQDVPKPRGPGLHAWVTDRRRRLGARLSR